MMDSANTKKYTILIVDDTPDNISLLSGLLKDKYKIKIATSGAKTLQIAALKPPPDLILLDVMMPDMDGYETCRLLKQDPETTAIPVIFLTAKSQAQDEEMGLTVGAADYISKPISPAIVLARVATQLKLRSAQLLLSSQKEHLEQLVSQRTHELEKMQDATIMAMASLAEVRDSDTGEHLRRTQQYVAALARHLQQHPRFAPVLTDANIELIFKSAPLHDIGKVGLPDRVLQKDARLTDDEIEIMKQHAEFGRDAIDTVESHLGSSTGFLTFAREIAYSHQEKWDGTGYPLGLKGDDIPLAARLMAVADVYDALITKRVYKPAFPHVEALEIMKLGRGTHFDPDILDGMLEIEGRFREIALAFNGAPVDPEGAPT